MSWTGFATGSNHLSGTLTTSRGMPLSMCAWIKMPAADWASTSSDIIIELNEDLLDEDHSISLRATRGAADRVSNFVRDAASASVADYDFTDGDYDNPTPIWVCVTGTWNTSSRYVYIENSSNVSTESTATRAATGMLEVNIGASYTGGSALENGYLAEVCIWNKVLTTSEIDQLQTASETGPAPDTVASGNVIAYWPLDADPSGLTNLGSDAGGDLTESGTAAYNADHPTITSGTTDVSYQAFGRGIQRGIDRGIG